MPGAVQPRQSGPSDTTDAAPGRHRSDIEGCEFPTVGDVITDLPPGCGAGRARARAQEDLPCTRGESRRSSLGRPPSRGRSRRATVRLSQVEFAPHFAQGRSRPKVRPPFCFDRAGVGWVDRSRLAGPAGRAGEAAVRRRRARRRPRVVRLRKPASRSSVVTLADWDVEVSPTSPARGRNAAADRQRNGLSPEWGWRSSRESRAPLRVCGGLRSRLCPAPSQRAGRAPRS